jgi:K+-transporting ATPase ATPase C chain
MRNPLLRQSLTALRTLLVMTLLLGVGYTAAVLLVGQTLLPAQANGSLLERDGDVVGSAVIGQSFTDEEGTALAEWFQSRPSAVGYDAGGSGGSNLGPESDELIAAIDERRASIAELEGVDPASVPADALTASASGLDPHISPAFATLQVPRIANARGLDVAAVQALVERLTEGRTLGYIGEPRVSVLALNLALAELD